MKPFGLTNPHAPDVKAYAIVQLRQDNKLATCSTWWASRPS
jgi:methylenetetrahydrofolate--tRNA-(uracil-5-)-methyltransferase